MTATDQAIKIEALSVDELLVAAFMADLRDGADGPRIREMLVQPSTIAAFDQAVLRLLGERERTKNARCPRCDRELQQTPSNTYLECSCPPVDDLAILREHRRSELRAPVDVALGALLDAGSALGLAHGRVMVLEDERPLIKARCIEAMIGTPNPLGKPGAVHSASSAEAIVEQHQDYWQHRQKQIAAEIAKHEAAAAFEAAKLRARLLVAFTAAGAE